MEESVVDASDQDQPTSNESAADIVAKLKSAIGTEAVFQAPDEMGRPSFRQYALAIGDFNPVYTDIETAKAHGLRDVMAPPTLICDTWQYVEGDIDGQGRLVALGDELEGGLRAGNDYEFFQPVHPDDVVTARRQTKDVYEKTGRSGNLVFWEVETRFFNQWGELLATNTETMFRRI